jgi:hypothetical protein
LAVPDSWQKTKPNIVPTLVLIFRRGTSSAYHSYSVPHPANTSPISEPPIETFTKGNFMAIAVMDDNSQIKLNCSSRSEAESTVNQFTALVDASYKTEGPPVRISERLGTPVATDVMTCVGAQFFEDGNRTLKPTWRRSFTRGF